MNVRIIFSGHGGQCSSLRTAVKGQHVSDNDNFLFWGWGRVSGSPGWSGTCSVTKDDTEFLSSCPCLSNADILPIWPRAWDPGVPTCKHSTSKLQLQFWELLSERLSPWQEGGLGLRFASLLSSPPLLPCLLSPHPPPLSPSPRAEVFFKSTTSLLVSSITIPTCSTYFHSNNCVPWLFFFQYAHFNFILGNSKHNL